MGRKIPAKKHRGVKDPAVQQARRLQRYLFDYNIRVEPNCDLYVTLKLHIYINLFIFV